MKMTITIKFNRQTKQPLASLNSRCWWMRRDGRITRRSSRNKRDSLILSMSGRETRRSYTLTKRRALPLPLLPRTRPGMPSNRLALLRGSASKRGGATRSLAGTYSMKTLYTMLTLKGSKRTLKQNPLLLKIRRIVCRRWRMILSSK